MKLIDTKEAYEIAREYYPAFGKSGADLTDLRKVLEDCTAIEAKPVVHAYWEYIGESDGKKIYRCTNCQVLLSGTGNFCKECGAQMDEKGEQ